MDHPGPPRFVAVGDDVELAPRDPDPAATYEWRLTQRPQASTATLGDDPVEHLVPDAPGRYRAQLTAPDATYTQTIRVFPDDPGDGGAGRSPDESVPAGASGRLTGQGREAADRSDRPDGDRSGSNGRPRIGLDARREGDAVVVSATPRPHPDSPESAADLDVEFHLDDRDALTTADVTVDGTDLTVPETRLRDCLDGTGPVRVHAVAVGRDGYSVPDAVAVGRDGGELELRRPYRPPSWTDDAVIYEIYVRTFPGQDTDPIGGDRSVFDAIVDRMDYLAQLGVDTLWLTPVLENDHAPHGYNVTDFFSIASDLGTRADYERFVDAAHERGLRVLFDLVCNHSARTHPHFQAAVADPDSEYREWYEWRGPTEPETYFEWEHIANFDFDHLPVRRHLLDAVAQWAPLVDGFRCDMAWAVPNGFWRELHDRMEARDTEFLLLDETIPYIPDFQAGLFDVHFDSTTYAALRRVGHGEDADALLAAVDERTQIGFPGHAGFMLYAENHDETRYLVDCGRPAAEAALGALFTLPGVPMIYAGQEFGQRGKRDDLAWAHADKRLQDHVQRLTAARDASPSLSARADLRRIEYDAVDGYDDRVVAFARTTTNTDGGASGEERTATITVLNFGADPATVAVGPETGGVNRVSGDEVATPEGLRVESAVVVSTDPDAL